MLGIFLDTETTGLDHTKHRVIEIAYQIIDLTTGELIHSFDSVIAQPIDVWNRADPSSLRVNGFTYDMIQDGPTEEEIAAQIKQTFQKLKIKRGKAVYICQNPSFDRVYFSQILPSAIQEKHAWPYHWLDLASMHWAKTLMNHKEKGGPLPWDTGFSKDKIAAFYNLPPEAMPHKASNGVAHLVECYKAVCGWT